MKLLFSGADNYLVQQKDANKSLGGQMSSTPVPNSRLNVIFNDISKSMLKGDKNTYAIFIYNDEAVELKNISLQQIYLNYKGIDSNDCIFRYGVVEPSDKGSIEIIGSSKEEPFYVDWFEPTTKKEQAYIKFKSMPIKGEVLNFLGKNITSTGNKFKDLIQNFEEAFKNDLNFEVFGVDVDKITIRKKNLTFNTNENLQITGSITLMYDVTDFAGLQGETIISESLLPGKALGLWIQREFMPRFVGNTSCLKEEDVDYLKKEDLEIIFKYEK